MLGLAVLEETDWSRRFHAYALATDTPDQLRRLFSTDDDEVFVAFGHLYGSVLHQGTVYPATAPALRFLAGLLDDPRWRRDLDGATVLTHVLRFLAEAGESATWLDFDAPGPAVTGDADHFFERLAADDDAAWSDNEVADGLMWLGVLELDAAADEILGAILPFTTDPDPATRGAAVNAARWWVQLPGGSGRTAEVAALADEEPPPPS